jgi:NADPH:quinone reductase-like Zn-dependent oxidoreductase
MKAIVQDQYGSADVLEFRDIEDPVVGDGDVLVRVHAAGCGPDVWHLMTGMPYMARPAIGLRRPKIGVRGWDVAGTVEAVGANVKGFLPGDQVMGTAEGSFAELVIAQPDKLVAKAAGLSFEQAAGVPISGTTALRAVRDKGTVQPGADSACHRRSRGRGIARRADRQSVRSGGHRCMQHVEGGPGPLDRRR